MRESAANDARLRAEDIPVGAVVDLGEHAVTRAEIIAFAQQWDPLPMHLDRDFARDTIFGDIIGSGLHTMAIFQRLAASTLYRDWAIVAGRSVDHVRLQNPLRPDTTVRATVQVTSVRPQSDRRSLVRKSGAVLHEDTTLLTLEVTAYVLRRDGET